MTTTEDLQFLGKKEKKSLVYMSFHERDQPGNVWKSNFNSSETFSRLCSSTLSFIIPAHFRSRRHRVQFSPGGLFLHVSRPRALLRKTFPFPPTFEENFPQTLMTGSDRPTDLVGRPENGIEAVLTPRHCSRRNPFRKKVFLLKIGWSFKSWRSVAEARSPYPIKTRLPCNYLAFPTGLQAEIQENFFYPWPLSRKHLIPPSPSLPRSLWREGGPKTVGGDRI